MRTRSFVALVLLLVACSRPRPAAPAERSYTRTEPAEIRAFYKADAPFYDKTPAELSRFVDVLRRETRLPRHAAEYPVDHATIARAADAFTTAAREVFGAALALDRDDAGQVDAFFDAHLIDRRARGGDIRVPDEPLLLYCAGSWWGEFLVRHRSAQWVLFPPLRPMQSFPDMITASNTACVHPFSQVTTKLSDPEGDSLAFAAKVLGRSRYFEPYPLIASMADAGEAAAMLLPPQLRGRNVPFERFDVYIALHPHAPVRIFDLAIVAAWQAARFDRVEQWSKRALALAPHKPVLEHNLAVLYSQNDRMPEAIALLEDALHTDANYGRAHLTLASCLLDSGRKAEARRHAEWVRDHDGTLRDEAVRLLEQADR